MSDETSSPSALERAIAIGTGVPLLLIGMSIFGWGVQLVAAGLGGDAGWPPGMGKLLLPIGITAVLVGIGGWRLLLTGVPPQVAGVSLWKLILAGFAAAALVGAVI